VRYCPGKGDAGSSLAVSTVFIFFWDFLGEERVGVKGKGQLWGLRLGGAVKGRETMTQAELKENLNHIFQDKNN
jgi:hypothetical protein